MYPDYVSASESEDNSELLNELNNTCTAVQEMFGSPKAVVTELEKLPNVPESSLTSKASAVDIDLENRLFQLCLPDVPEEEERFTNPIDEEIETTLLRLKFFRKSCC